MTLVECQSMKDRKALLKFYKGQYVSHPLRRDSMSGLLKAILYERSVMNASIKIKPLMVKEGNEVVMGCVLAKAHRMPECLQIAFFESTKFCPEAFKLIYDAAVAEAEKCGATQLTASLNIHVNYGLGFLADGYEKPQSFGMAHNESHVHEYFQNNDFEVVPMLTFYKDMRADFEIMNQRLKVRLKERYTVRHADFSNLKQESALYTAINNDAFRAHPFYYPRVEAEDYELFKDFKYLLKPENLLFVEKNGEAVGFMLWYPDFHQIMSEHETVNLWTVFKRKICKRKLKGFKVVEMGVRQSEQKRGAILALFDHCFDLTKGVYESFESGWVLSQNTDSGNFGYKWSDGVSKRYMAYVKVL